MSNAPIQNEPVPIPLYPEGASGSEHWEQEEQWSDIWWSDNQVIRNVSQPTLTPYLPDPDIARGTGVVLCPGGAFHFLAYQEEGVKIAHWLNAQGIAAFILKYRLVQTGDNYVEEVQQNMADRERMTALMAPLQPLLLNDGQQAIRIVRERATDWNLHADRIGMVGYSAGGSVALNVALTHEDDCRPDFTAAIYTGSWSDKPIPSDAGPLFILCAADDAMASPNSIRLYNEWRAVGHRAELHIYSQGGHGFCLRTMDLPVDTWVNRLADWLEAEGFA